MEASKAAVEALSAYYRKNFCGILGKFKAFIWDGKLAGVKNQDPITFDDLIGYEFQQQQLIRNTEVLFTAESQTMFCFTVIKEQENLQASRRFSINSVMRGCA